MPLYRYEARDRAGQTVIGTMQVADEAALERRLNTMGYVPLAVEATGRRGLASPAAAPAPAAGSPGSLRTQSLSRFYFELRMSLHAGMSAHDALTHLAAQAADRPTAAIAASMAEVAQLGGSLADGMSRFPAAFLPGDIGLVRAAEVGGFVPEALQELHTLLEADIETRRRVRFTLAGLWVLLVIALLVTLPAVATLKSTITASWNGAQQPETLRLLGTIWLRTVLIITGPVLLGGLGGWWLLRRSIRSPSGRLRWHRLMLRLPGFGNLAYARSRGVFAAALRLLYHGGVRPPAAWAAASDAVPNCELSRRLAMQSGLVERGVPFSEAMRGSGVFSPADAGMLATGERTGNVEEVLAQIADAHHRAAGEALARLPVVARIWALVIGGLVTAILSGYGMYNYASTLVGLPTDG